MPNLIAQIPGLVAGGAASFMADIGYTVIGKIFFAIAYVVAWIAGVAIAIEAWLVGVVLNMNTGVFDSAIVQKGFGVTLSIANLGFVLGIIVIALATILRRESYGVKQLLWKLVVAAILVNFSLVIMAPIFGFTNSLTQCFLNSIDPGGGGCSGTGGAVNNGNSMNYFANSLAGAFNPQNGFASLNLVNATGTAINPNNGVQGAFAATGSSLGKMLIPIFSLFSVGALLTVIVITLGALIIMLIVRYVYIAILAVLMPFAWLMWVFPKLSSHWSKWWHNFIKWSFFAPLVVFFLYLAIITAQSMGNATSGSQSFATYTSNSNVVWGSISSFFTSFFSPIIQNILNQVVLIALCIGGIFAANSMGIAGADMAMKAVGAVKDASLGYANKQRQKIQRAAYRKVDKKVEEKFGRGITQRLQESRIRPVAILGRAVAPHVDNRDLVEAAAKSVPNDKEAWTRQIKSSMNTETQMAYLAKGEKEGWVDRTTKVDGVNIDEFLNKNKEKFKGYGQSGEGSLEEKLRFKTGLLQGDVDQKNKKLEGENAALDTRRATAPESDVQQKAKLSDDDMQFHSTAKKEDVDANFTEEDKKRWYDIEAKTNKAKQSLGLEEPDQNKYDANADKIAGNKAKLARYMVKDPETTSKVFFDDEKARAKFTRENPSKEVPETLKKENVDREREFVIQTVLEKFSASNARALFDAIAKANNLQYFEKVVNETSETKTVQFKSWQALLEQNKDLKRWMQNNSGKALFGGLRELFGLKKINPKTGEEIPDTGSDEDDNQPSGQSSAQSQTPPTT